MTEEKSQLEISQGANQILKKRIVNYRNLAGQLIEQNVKTAAIRAGNIRQKAMPDLLERAKRTFTVLEDGSAIEPRDEKGGMIFGKGGNPVSMDEWASELKKSAPHLWEPNKQGQPGGNIENLEAQLTTAVERRDLQAQIRLKRLISEAQQAE